MFCGNGSVCRPPRRRRAFTIGVGVPTRCACAGVGAELSLTGEPGNNDAGEDAEDDFADQAVTM